MEQLVLSGQNLNQQRVLETGTLNISSLLDQQAKDKDWIQVRSALPKGDLQLEWKEVRTPSIASGLQDLVGKKMLNYNFQYIGRFSYNGVLITRASETFEANFPAQNIHKTTRESDGWVNCTWLVDGLVNAAKINGDALRKELLIWDQNPDGYCLSLSNESIDYKHGEQQKFLFAEDFNSLAWEHLILFGN